MADHDGERDCLLSKLVVLFSTRVVLFTWITLVCYGLFTWIRIEFHPGWKHEVKPCSYGKCVPGLKSEISRWRSINNTIAGMFLSTISALVHLNTCIKLIISQRIDFKKRKRALLAMVINAVLSSFHSGMKSRPAFTWIRIDEISNQNETGSIRNENRVELIPEWTTSHSGFM